MTANTRIDYHYEREYTGYRCNQYLLHRVCTHKKIIGEPNLEQLVLDSIKPAIQNYIAWYEVQISTSAKPQNNISKLKEKQHSLKELYTNGYIEFEEFKAAVMIRKIKLTISLVRVHDFCHDAQHVIEIFCRVPHRFRFPCHVVHRVVRILCLPISSVTDMQRPVAS